MKYPTDSFGVLNVNKPAGVSSRRVVDAVQRIVRPDKAGHAGTLDPIATGVLVVCVGPATRLIPYVQHQRKTYRGTFLLGKTSETDDVEGELTDVAVAAPPTEAEVRGTLPSLTGRIEQTPPAFSAVKVDGQRAYALARAGRDVELSPRTVEVHRLEILRFEYPELELEVECGSGTYVRSIGRDLGRALGCGAVMTGLERTRIGSFRIEDAVSIDDLSLAHLQPPLCCVDAFPRHVCGSDDFGPLVHGRPLALSAEAQRSLPVEPDRPVVLVDADERLLGVAFRGEDGTSLRPRHVFVRP